MKYKKIFTFLFFLFIFYQCVLTAAAASPVPDSQTTYQLNALIKDPVLAQAVGNILGIGMKEEVSLDALSEIETLEYIGKSNPIHSLEGIGYLTGLKKLVLGNNEISDISALTDLADTLTELYIWENPIADFSDFSLLKNLHILDINNTSLDSLEDIAELEQLVELYCWETQLSDLSLLTKLPDLEILDINSNPIEDISCLAALSKLKELYVWNVGLKDIEVLGSLTNLEILDLNQNQIDDISVLSSLSDLEELHIWENKLEDLSPLTSLHNLKKLDIHKNNISNLYFMNDLEQLEFVDALDQTISLAPASISADFYETENPIYVPDTILSKELSFSDFSPAGDYLPESNSLLFTGIISSTTQLCTYFSAQIFPDQWELNYSGQILIPCAKNELSLKLIFDYQNADSGNEIASKPIYFGEKIGDLPRPGKENYLFQGWYTEPKGMGLRIDPDYICDFTMDTTVYAYFAAAPVTVLPHTGGPTKNSFFFWGAVLIITALLMKPNKKGDLSTMKKNIILTLSLCILLSIFSPGTSYASGTTPDPSYDPSGEASLSIHKYAALESWNLNHTGSGALVSDSEQIGTDKDDQPIKLGDLSPVSNVTFAITLVEYDGSGDRNDTASYLPVNTEEPYTAKQKTNAQGLAFFPNLAHGIYLVHEEDHPAVTGKSEDFVISVPCLNAAGSEWLYDVHAYPKNILEPSPEIRMTITDLEKTEDSFHMNETITWFITASIPDSIEDAEAYQITFTFDPAIVLKEADPLKIYTDEILFTESDFDLKSDLPEYTIDFSTSGLQKLADVKATHDSIYVQLNTAFHPDPAPTLSSTYDNPLYTQYLGTPMKSDASLYYQNGLHVDMHSDIPVKPAAYTGGLAVKKVDISETLIISPAEFLLFDEKEDALHYLNTSDEDAARAAAATEDGTALFYGLQFGDYWLVEKTAPEGYIRLKSPLPVTVHRQSHQEAQAAMVVNAAESALPLTSSMGTILFGAAGLVLITFSTFTYKRAGKKK